MENEEFNISKLKPGDNHYRAFIGSPQNYDLMAAICFNLLTTLGLRESHRLLDIGCGSLRNGRLFIPFLNQHCYYGIEPNAWLVSEGIKNEVGSSLIDIKKPRFSFRSDCAEIEKGLKFDFIFLQSIFSHCGTDLIAHWLAELYPLMDNETLLVGTYFKNQRGYESSSVRDGWVYPSLVSYTEERFKTFFKPFDLQYQEFKWPHPMQQWFMATKSNSSLARASQTGLIFQTVYNNIKRPNTAKLTLSTDQD